MSHNVAKVSPAGAARRWAPGVCVLLACLAVLLLTQGAIAQEADVSEPSSTWVDHFVVKGGWITWFVLIPLSVATVALAVEHAVTIRQDTILPAMSRQKLTSLLADRKYAEAVRFAAQDPSMLARVSLAGLTEANRGYAAMERAVQERLDDASARLMRKIEYLNVIGNVSPMIGLFGTVYGMIRLFASIRSAGAIPEPAVIADDISIALVTTFWGLGIAIPALSIFALFRNRIDVLTADVAIACEKLLAAFKPGGESAKSTATQRPAPDPPAVPVG